MAFRVTNENPLPDLVELKTKLAGGDGADLATDVRVELRIHPHEIDDHWWSVRVCFTQATLSLEVVGLEITEKSKFGQPVVPNATREISRESNATDAQEKTFEGKLAAKASLQDLAGIGGEASLGMTKKASSSSSVKDVEKITIANTFVRAIGNDNWSIKAEDILDGVYLDYDSLCSVTPSWGGNRQGITTRLLVKQKHIRSSLVPAEGLVAGAIQTINQKRIAAILLAKSLHDETSTAQYSGVICLARSEASDED